MNGDHPPDNGYIRWRDLDQHRETEAAARHLVADKMEQRMGGLEHRVNTMESVIDQQRGARAMVYALIGTNAAAIVIGLIAVFR